MHRPLLDRFRRACFGGTVEERWEGDWLRATILSDECDYLAGWMLSFGTSLEVVEPASLRERLVELARGGWSITGRVGRRAEGWGR